MQAMMAQQQMSMQSFMDKFPQPPDEAERRLVLLKKRLMTAPLSELSKVDDVLINMCISGALPEQSRGIMLNVIGEDTQRALSVVLKLEDGKLLTTKDLPPMMLDGMSVRQHVATHDYGSIVPLHS